MKQRIKLTESDLHRIVKESVKRILKEEEYFPSLDDNKRLKQIDTDYDWADIENERLRMNTKNRRNAEEAQRNLDKFTHGANNRPYHNYLDRNHFRYGDKSLWSGHNGIE